MRRLDIVDGNVFKIAATVLSLPTTSAATERSFSAFEGVHTKKRNRLTNARIEKLVFIRHNMRLLTNCEEQPGNIHTTENETSDDSEDDVDLDEEED